ncbi:hypothetical protein DPMN_147602 [Dreissena polymorpha]|uniref:Uncharacterized protein n=1 Tax=Dreissena polymorpha TaxID=45954 RepID=A0A9D4FA53_DREPO|nr:hypothetical protein DPMN_147602 [Dreissena polymorpha]
METEGIEDEIVETEIYMMDLCMQLDTLIAERDQQDTSIGSQQPTFHPMDTQLGRGDTGLGGQQTTFHPDDTPPTLKNGNSYIIQSISFI